MRCSIGVLCGVFLGFASFLSGVAEAASVFSATRGMNLIVFVSSAGRPGSGIEYVPYQQMCTPNFVRKLASSGVEFARLVATPVPLMQPDAAARRSAIEALTNCGDRLVANGLAVIYDMQFWSPDNNDRQREALSVEPQREQFRTGLLELAIELSKRPQDSVALELLNEPPRCEEGGHIDWRTIQRQLVNEIRRRAALLPLVVTGCGGSADVLFALSDEPFLNDQNLIYTLHFYEPFIFTHQFTWSGNTIDFLTYPVPKSGAEVLINEGLSRLNLATIGARQKMYASNELRKYVRNGYGPADMDRRFRQIVEWGKKHNIPQRRIFVGEFGASVGFASVGVKPEVRQSEIRWLRDVREAAERHQLKHAYWLFPRSNMFAYDSEKHFLKPDFIDALGLRVPD